MTAPGGLALGEVGRLVAAGATWMVGLRAVNRLIGLVSLTILARLLLPQDFGLVAMAVAVAAFIDMFGQTQVDVALIRDQTADRSHYDSAWTLNILRGMVVAAILAACAHPVARFFSEPRLVDILYAVGAIQLVGSFVNIGVVDFRKDLHFRREFIYRLSSRVTGAVLTVALALIWQNVWVLVAGMALRTVIAVILSYAMCRYRPRVSFARFSQIFGFSKWVLVQSLFYELREKTAVFVIGRMLNVEALGLFNLAREIGESVTTEFRAPMRRALFPGFAKMSAENGDLRTGFIEAFATMLIVSLPLSVGLYLVAPLVVEVLLGPRWSGALPLIEILALYGIVQSFGTSSHLVYNRIGRPRFTAAINVAHFIVFVPSVIWGVSAFGAEGAAWAITASAVIFLAADILIVRRVIGVGLRAFAAHVWRPVVAAGCMAAAVLSMRDGMPDAGNPLTALATLFALAVAGAAVYVAVDLALWAASRTERGVERHIVGAVRRLLHACLPVRRSY